MIKGKKLVAMVLLFMAMVAPMFEGSEAAITLCNMSEDGLKACQPAVTAPSPEAPTQQCCDALSVANLTCLCDYKNNNSFVLKALGIDPDLAVALPPKCSLTNPANC